MPATDPLNHGTPHMRDALWMIRAMSLAHVARNLACISGGAACRCAVGGGVRRGHVRGVARSPGGPLAGRATAGGGSGRLQRAATAGGLHRADCIGRRHVLVSGARDGAKDTVYRWALSPVTQMLISNPGAASRSSYLPPLASPSPRIAPPTTTRPPAPITQAPMPSSSRSGRVDASAIVYKHSKSLRLPSSSRGTPADWAAVASQAAGLLADDYSLASAMGQSVDAPVVADAAADMLFTSREKALYAAHKRRPSLPSVDWRRLRTTIPGPPSARRRWQTFVPPLTALYATSVTPENAKAFVDKYTDLVPLLVAVRKVDAVRKDASAGKASSAARRYFHELVACRRLMSELGTQRARSSSLQKAANKDTQEREDDLVKRLSKLDRAGAPSGRADAEKVHQARMLASKKLAKARAARVADGTSLKRQNIELTTLETMLRSRMIAIQEKLEKETRSAGRSRK